MATDPLKEYISERVFLYRTADCRFGEDALRLAEFAAPEAAMRVCDLGTGGGILPLWWHAQPRPPLHIDAVELQSDAAALAARSVAENGLSDRIAVHTADWNELQGRLPAGGYDLVTCNPPYFPAGGGKVSQNDSDRIARHEPSPAMLSQLCAAMARLCKMGGQACLCHRPERMADVLCALRESGLEPKQVRILCHGDTPWLLLVRAQRGGHHGVTVEISR